jgi:acetyl esterase/lipase
MKIIRGVLLWLGLSSALWAQSEPVVPLWPAGQVPAARGEGPDDVPTLTVFLPEAGKATGAAMVICPGGGYGGLAQHEGRDYALFLRREGVACFVLRYRLGSHGYRHPVMLGDAARAVRLVRSRAAEWGVTGGRVGIMGSSAGGHLASTLVTHFDGGNAASSDAVEREASRPTLGVLCYPVITLGKFTHGGSKQNLLGTNPPADLVENLSNELQVRKDGPPVFVWHTWEDTAVPVENALLFADGMRRAGVPFDLHIYEKGRHGIGLQAKPPGFENAHPWAADLVFWLRGRGFVR